MRAIVPLVSFLVCGCSSRVSKQEVADPAGSNRLALIDRRVWSVDDILHSSQSYNFHSLVWRARIDDRWNDRVVISKDAFQAGGTRTRWVSEIHSLDARSGTAIIKVAEGDAPMNAPLVRYIYSWREWSLITNGEVRLIRTCVSPF